IEKQASSEAATHDRFQELLWNNLIGIDVGAIERRRQTGKTLERLHPTLLLRPFADVDKMPRDRRGRGHLRAYQMSTSALALTAFEIAVRRAGTSFARLQ